MSASPTTRPVIAARPLLVTVLSVCAVLSVLVAGAADAKRKSRPPPPEEPLDIVVLPFDVLRGKDARAAREALELELELVDNVRVQDNGALKADLDKARDPLAATTIKAAMGRRSIEVLVLTPPGYERPIVAMYGADGRPRVVKELPRGAGPDQMAATALTVLRPALADWRALPPIALPATKGAAVDDDDVIADVPPKKPGKGKREPVVDEVDDPIDPPARRRGLDDDEEDAPLAAADDDDDDDSAAARKRRAALDDAEDDSLDGGRRRTIDDVEEPGRSSGGPIKSTHVFAASGTFDGAGWSYIFDGNNNLEPDPVNAGFYPGGSLRLDLWPTEFFGIDAGIGVSSVQFLINSSANITVAPSRFASLHINTGGAVKLRWLARFADDGPLRLIGLGGRLGYRFWQGSVETQRVNGTDRILTVVPGFSVHSLAVGPEIYLPIFVFDRRIELELKADTLPLTRYAESPDNPGRNSLAFGYHAELLLRADVINGFFIEAAGTSTGLTVNFEGTGDRVTVESGTTLVPLQGGRALNATVGFSVGVGFMF